MLCTCLSGNSSARALPGFFIGLWPAVVISSKLENIFLWYFLSNCRLFTFVMKEKMNISTIKKIQNILSSCTVHSLEVRELLLNYIFVLSVSWPDSVTRFLRFQSQNCKFLLIQWKECVVKVDMWYFLSWSDD